MANVLDTRREQMFPKLTPAQIDRLEAYGSRMRIRAGEVLTEPGDRHGRILVVLSGAIEVVLPGIDGETPITVHTAGSFGGEMSALRGSGATVRARVREDGEVIAIEHEGLLRVVQNDAELSELFMRAFILRRMGLIQARQGDVVLIGSSHSAATLRLRQFLGRNGFPYASLDVDRDPDVAALLERFQVGIDEVPVVICRGETVLRNPTNEQLADCLRMNPEFDDATVRDLIVIGAGPAGLAAAVYGASEGLDVLVLETTAAGGQAGTSSKIENYLGFPTGISGQALAARALVQAQKFGADVAVAGTVVKLLCHRRPYRIELASGRVVHARTIVVATGAEYRPIAIENLSQFVGAGVYYAATYLEAQICRGEEAIVVGGGNSAGQAAVFLASGCRHVHLLVRSSGLAATMSRYLIRRIEENPNITLRPFTEIAALDGNGQLERVTWRSQGDQRESRDIGHVFLMTGAVPNARWLAGWVALDDKGFVRTGSDLSAEDLAATRWPLAREPHLLETSRPGIFAVGDVRSGSIKRVAAAVGEGSTAVQFVHRALQE
ncbi:MAG TPA: FAD-dependent oxidoreductase [Candidatus Eisenbacteria bacterium]|nr:FAD-dependent oxidoreductase [Candidatus Eisenbacteria bacterium]